MPDYPYDARNPAPGVKVAGVPRPRVTNLSMGQARAWRNTNGSTPHHRRGGPVGVRGQTLFMNESPPRQVAKHARPARKKYNKAFKKQTRYIDPLANLNRDTKRCNRACLHALLGKIPQRDYDLARKAFLDDYPEHAHIIVEIERRNAGIARAAK